jgi:hypothetical protein
MKPWNLMKFMINPFFEATNVRAAGRPQGDGKPVAEDADFRERKADRAQV